MGSQQRFGKAHRATIRCRQCLPPADRLPQIELIERAAAPAGGAAGGPRTLSSGIRISGERGGRTVQLTRTFQQAAGGTARAVRGRGSVRGRSGPTAMED
jgi:hypothetical protein